MTLTTDQQLQTSLVHSLTRAEHTARSACHHGSVPPRFVPLVDVAETLSISAAQAYALVRRGDLRAIQVGGRGQWRVEVAELENYIERQYAETSRSLPSKDHSDS